MESAAASPPAPATGFVPALRRLSVSTLRWWTGLFCSFLGAFMVVAPQEFGGATYRAIELRPLSWGIAFLVAGAAMVTAAALRPRRRFYLVAHLLTAGVLSLLAGGFAGAGSWAGAAVYTVFLVGVLIAAPAAPRSPLPRRVRRGDLFSTLMAGAGVVVGALLLLAPASVPSAAYLGDRARWLGALLVLSCPLLFLVQLRPGLPRRVVWTAHLLSGLALLMVMVFLSVPVRASTGIALWGSGGVTVALLPALRRSLQDFDPGSLRTRLALAFAAATTLSLLVTVALVTAGTEQLTAQELSHTERDKALSLARNVVDYLELVVARNGYLAAAAGRAPWEPRPQLALLATAADEHPRISGLATFAEDGEPLARVGRRTLPRLWALRFAGELLAGDGAEVAYDILDDGAGPMMVVASPVYADGARVGLLLTGYDGVAVLRRLSRQALGVRVVDGEGRVLVSDGLSADDGEATTDLLAAEDVPGGPWRVEVVRTLSPTLAALRRGRLQVFLLLVVVVLLAVVAGALAARLITGSLERLAAAADELAAGKPAVPLTATGITEVDRLSANFRDMRDRLEVRTRESERLAEESRERAERLAEADRRKDEFLAMLGHELRNPLGAISTATFLLGELRSGEPRTERAVGVIRRQMEHLTRMVDDLLDVSRITRGKVAAAALPARSRLGRGARRGDRRADDRRPPPRAPRRAARRAADPGGRRHPSRAGAGEPAAQRRQVHRGGGPPRDRGPAARATRRWWWCATTAWGSLPTCCRGSSTSSPRAARASTAPAAAWGSA